MENKSLIHFWRYTLRKNYVHNLYEDVMKNIQHQIRGKKIWNFIDETMDVIKIERKICANAGIWTSDLQFHALVLYIWDTYTNSETNLTPIHILIQDSQNVIQVFTYSRWEHPNKWVFWLDLLYIIRSASSNITYIEIFVLTPAIPWLSYSPLDPRIAGLNPARVNGFFQSVKILSMTSFGRD